MDFGRGERSDQAVERVTLQIRRTRRHGHKFAAGYERRRFYVDHPLNFQRLNKVGADLLVGQQLPTDAFDDPAYRLNVGRGLRWRFQPVGIFRALVGR